MKNRPPRVLVAGTGSAGRRHMTNLLALGAEVWSLPSIHGPLPSGVSTTPSLEEATALRLNAVVVANRTSEHMNVALWGANLGLHLFIEKPLSHTLDKVDDLVEVVSERQLVVESGFMLRFHPNARDVKRWIEAGRLGELHYVRAAVGQFLPEWRQGRDYKDSYSAHKDQGGGVVFDLVHELDLLAWWLGDVREVAAMLSHVPSLAISSEAVAQILLRFDNGVIGQVCLDYVRPVYRRAAEIVGSKGILEWDYQSGVVTFLMRDQEEVVSRVSAGFERNAMFRHHMHRFLTRISDGRTPAGATLDEGLRVLKVALACHASAAARRNVSLQEIDGK